MRSLLFALFLAPAIMGYEVTELTDDSWSSEMESMDTALVMFYAPWCGHCKRMKPEFEKAASILEGNDPPVHLVKVDCTESGKDTCGKFEVRGYPTLKIFRGGELSQDYNGPREVNGIVKYMKAQVGPSSKECSSDSDVDKLRQKDEVVVVGYYDDEEEMSQFQKAADSMRETVAFGHCKKCGKKGVVLYRPKQLQTKLEPSEVEYDGEAKKSDISAWVKKNYHGLVGHRTVDNSKDFGRNLVVAYYDVDYVKNAKGTNYWRNRVMKVAKNFPSLTFAVSNKDDFMQEVNEFGIGMITGDKPKVGIFEGKSKKFVMEDDFTVDAFEKFVNDYKDGNLEPYLKSEDVPASQDKPVKVAVAKNFDDLIFNSGKDALIEFYAPWCGHCKKLTPIYDELGEKMADEDVVIAKMDATANDVPDGFDVQGFPTIYWLPKNSKKPVSYGAGRELDDFVKYIAKEASEELKGFDRSGKAKKVEL